MSSNGLFSGYSFVSSVEAWMRIHDSLTFTTSISIDEILVREDFANKDETNKINFQDLFDVI